MSGLSPDQHRMWQETMVGFAIQEPSIISKVCRLLDTHTDEHDPADLTNIFRTAAKDELELLAIDDERVDEVLIGIIAQFVKPTPTETGEGER